MKTVETFQLHRKVKQKGDDENTNLSQSDHGIWYDNQVIFCI